MEGASIDVSVCAETGLSIPADLASYSLGSQKHACVQNAIVGKDCKIGQWGRVDGEPAAIDGDGKKLDITILGGSLRCSLTIPGKSTADRYIWCLC